MEKSKVIKINQYKIIKKYYMIGLLLGALRSELESGTVELETVYSILTEPVKSALSKEVMECTELFG